MQTNTEPQINLFNLPNNQSSVKVPYIQQQDLPSNNPEKQQNQFLKRQQKSQNKQPAMLFQQPSFLKSFQEYLSGHFKLIQTQFLSFHNKFNHFDSITLQMKQQINSLQKQLQSKKINQLNLINQIKSQKQVPYVHQTMKETNQKMLFQIDKKNSQKQIPQIQQNQNQSHIEKGQSKIDENILSKLESYEKRIVQLQKINTKRNQPFNFQITQELPAWQAEKSYIRQVSTSIQPKINIIQQNHKQVVQSRMTSDFQISKNLYEVVNKKIYQLQNSFNDLEQKVKSEIQKKNKPIQTFAYEVQSLKNQIQEFKLKRQAKYLKMISKQPSVSVEFTTFNHAKKSNSNHENNNSTQEYLTYLSEKVQYLLAASKEFLPKQFYESEIEHIHEVLSAIRKRLGEKVNYKDLSKVRSIEDVSGLKKPEFNAKDEIVVSSKDPNAPNEEKANSLESDKDQVKETLGQDKKQVLISQDLKQKITPQQKQYINPNLQSSQNPQKFGIDSSLLSQIQAKLDSHQEFLKNMNKFYNQKLNLIEINLQKITSSIQQNIKTQDQKSAKSLSSSLLKSPQLQSDCQEHTYDNPTSYNLKNHLNHKQDLSSTPKSQLSYIPNTENPSRSQLIDSINQQKKPDQLQPQQMYNFEFTNIRKKISKLNGKFDQIEGNVKNFRQDIMKYIEMVQKNDQNKTDWDSFKKAVKYFDQKIKGLQKTITKIIQIQNEQNSSNHQGLESNPSQIAAKKKWSCLLCDKQFKNYEGRTSQIRYLGMASGVFKHESPRAVSYMKQSLRQKQYEKIFMKSPVNNEPVNTGIRKRSLSKSKQYMKNLNEKISFFDQENNQKSAVFEYQN